MKDAGRSTRIDKPHPDDTPPVSVPKTGPRPQDGRHDPAQQERNREDMGVTESHKTEDMEEKGRGTYP